MPRLKAEWEKQEGTLLVFPPQNSDWSDILDLIIPTYLEIITTILQYQKVFLLGENQKYVFPYLPNTLLTNPNFIFLEIETNDTWIRDFGPISVEENGITQWYDYNFNGWGLKFPAFLDNLVTQCISDNLDICNTKIMNIVLEGGGIESDGRGVLLTTSSCMLSPNRSPSYSKNALEEKLKRDFSLKTVLWLDHGYLSGDDTDSHIDTLARFCNETTICYVGCEDFEDEHYEALLKMKKQLQGFTTKEGKPYTLIELPFPKAQYYKNDIEHRLPATYANFLFINEAVLVPVYNDPSDNKALNIFTAIFPKRKIIPINCNALIMQHGSLHCSAMQLY